MDSLSSDISVDAVMQPNGTVAALEHSPTTASAVGLGNVGFRVFLAGAVALYLIVVGIRLLRRFVLDLQSCHVVKQFLIATGKLLNPDPRRITPAQLRTAGGIILRTPVAPVRYCFYCSAGIIARTVYTISTSPKYLLPRRRHIHSNNNNNNASAQKSSTLTVHRKYQHHAQNRRVHHFRALQGQGQFSVPRDLCLHDNEDDAAAASAANAVATLIDERGGSLSKQRAFLKRSQSSPNIHSNGFPGDLEEGEQPSNNVRFFLGNSSIDEEEDGENDDNSSCLGNHLHNNHQSSLSNSDSQCHDNSFQEANNNNNSSSTNSIVDSYCSDDNEGEVKHQFCDKLCDNMDHVCLEHVLGEDPKYRHVLRKYNTRLSLYRKLPWKTISRLWGRLHQLELPVWLRSPAFRLYIWLFQCKLQEASVTDLRRYRNLSEFFRRTLRPGVRSVDGAHVLTSPADGTMLYLGEVEGGVLEQVKGVAYSLRGFMGPKSGLLFNRAPDAREGYFGHLADEHYARSLLTNPRDNVLYHCITYLAPGDYHRFHSPADWTVTGRRHFPGELFSVKPGVARWLQGLFNYNERAVYTGRWRYGFFSMAAVGATNVGSINMYFDKDLYTNCPHDTSHEVFYDVSFLGKKKSGVQVKKGQLMGDFNLGSTIVLIFEAPRKFRFKAREGQKVRYGQGIGLCPKRVRFNSSC